MEAMIRKQLIARGIKDTNVLNAIRKVKRELFVPENLQSEAYADKPLNIGYNQTISQPYIVAFMTEAASLSKNDKVLEIGTGSGYQSAILAEIVKEVFSVEIISSLVEQAKNKLSHLNYKNIQIKSGDGNQGWKEHAPYDAILVTAAPEQVPKALIDQLKKNGRLIIPVGTQNQNLIKYSFNENQELVKETLLPVRFVPMVS